MYSTLAQTNRHFPASGRKLLRLGVPVLLAVSVLTVAASVPAAAQVPRIKKPSAPTAVTADPLGGGATVSWSAPASDGGSPITAYSVKASHGGQTCGTTGVTTCTLSGLTNGHRYILRVRAVNASGEGPVARALVTPSLPTVSFGGPTQFPYLGPIGVELSQPSTTTVQVEFATTDGPEVSLNMREWIGDAADINPTSGTVAFAPGQTLVSIPFTPIQTNVSGCSIAVPFADCWPSITVALASPTNALLGPSPDINVFFGS